MERRKHNLLFVIILLGTSLVAMTQEVPYGINYQAVARDSYGNELVNQRIDIRFTVISSNPLGDIQYQEVHYDISTSRYGVFSVIIGKGTPTIGICESFSGIDWESAPHYLKVEIKFSNEFMEMGTMQFLSVPYALYAAKSLEAGPQGPEGPAGPAGPQGEKGEPGDPATDDQTLSFDGQNLSISGGNTVPLTPLVNDADADPLNEIQYLSIAGDSLSITNGNSIKLQEINIDDADANPENEIQDLIIENNILRISKNQDYNPIDLSKYLDNTDRQELGFNMADSTLSISSGNSIDLSDVLRDPDTDEFNEIQDLSLEGNILSVTMNSGATSIDLGPYLDNTDDQELSYNPETHILTIENGTSQIDLDELKDDADADPSNELVTELTVDGTDLVLKEGSNEKRVDLSSNVVAFRALKEVNTSAAMPLSNVDFIPDSEIYNDGLGLNMSTGEFTASYDGIYTFNITYSADGTGSSRELMIYLNGNLYENIGVDILSGDVLYRSVTMKLSSQDKVKLVIHTGTGTSIGTGSFSGFRVY